MSLRTAKITHEFTHTLATSTLHATLVSLMSKTSNLSIFSDFSLVSESFSQFFFDFAPSYFFFLFFSFTSVNVLYFFFPFGFSFISFPFTPTLFPAFHFFRAPHLVVQIRNSLKQAKPGNYAQFQCCCWCCWCIFFPLII